MTRSKIFVFSLCLLVAASAPVDKSSSTASSKLNVDKSSSSHSKPTSSRSGKSYLPSWFDYYPSEIGYEDPLMSRASSAEADSPIYYIRLPPSPYMFVPGLGYVSRPEPPKVPVAPPPPPPVRRTSPFIQLPLDFVSNGKPGSSVQIWPGGLQPTQRPKPTRPAHTKPSSTVTKLKGPFYFNGKPNGMYVLQQDPYNSFYTDVLHNFYP